MCARRYDYNANKEGLDEVTLAGDLIEASSDDDVAVGYDPPRCLREERSQVDCQDARHHRVPRLVLCFLAALCRACNDDLQNDSLQ